MSANNTVAFWGGLVCANVWSALGSSPYHLIMAAVWITFSIWLFVKASSTRAEK